MRREGSLRIAVIAPSRYPLRQPHAGGLETAVWERVRSLRARGHDVVLCAPVGSDFLSGDAGLALPQPSWPRGTNASDVEYPPGYLDHVTRSLDAAMGRIAMGGFDIVDNHSLHGTPIAWADQLPMPLVTTLHTPPVASILAQHRAVIGATHTYLAVSRHTQRVWEAAGVNASVLPNAVDTRRWAFGPGGQSLVWFGRIVPEKAPHLAIDAARAVGRRLVIAGRIGDHDYYEREVRPHIGHDVHYVGALCQPALARLVGRSAAALVTPVWDEPFGLVIAEAMSTGTPVAAFDAGGVAEVIGNAEGAAVVPRGDIGALANAVSMLIDASTADPDFRAAVRRAAVRRHSLERRHDELEAILTSLAANVPERSAAA